DGGQSARGGRGRGERYGERRGGGRGDVADRAVVEDHRVVDRRRVEAEAVDRDRGRVGGQAGGPGRDDRRDRGHLHRRAAALPVGGDDGGQIADGGRFGGERHGERGRGRGRDRADRAVVEHDRVMGRRRVEAEAIEGERIHIGGQAGGSGRDDRRDGGHLDRRAAALRIGRHHDRQTARGLRLGGERHGERSRGRGRDRADGPVVERDRVMGRRGVE